MAGTEIRWRGWGVWCAATLAAVALSCRGKLPTPRYSAQPTSALVPVPYPPPPARVEIVPDSPQDGAVWIDGEWSWDGRRWGWKLGRWLVPPPSATFSPWTTVRSRAGILYFAGGVWRDERGERISEPQPLAVANASTGPVVGPHGESFPAGQNIEPGEEDAGS